MNYRVTWEIDILAATPEDAARQARKYQLDGSANVGYFTVHWMEQIDGDAWPEQVDVDLDELGDDHE